jgi:4-amino-4-deoxy-L-arabinose transferase-like glycosyltransferase
MASLVHPRADEPGVGLGAARTRLIALARGGAEEAAWARAAMVGVGLLAAVLYIWNLTVSGYANVYYSGAALAGAQSWSAWFFGSIDSSNFITVDKPPLAVMLMGLSVRVFGLSSWSILLPEALLGVASVLLLFSLVRRTFGPAAALIAATVMALTPAAVLMFRYNNPDALLTFLLIAGAWALQRSIESGRTRWLVLAAVFVGLGFNAKFLQAYLVLPAFVATWLIAAPVTLRRRVGALVPMAVAGFISSFWWVGVVELIPADQRPFIGGSTDGSALQLLFGYDGLGRIFGEGAGPGGGGPGGGGPGGGGGFSGAPEILRLFNAQLGDQVSWLIPLALVGLAAGLLIHTRARRTDPRRAAYLLWGGWFFVTAAVFSLMSGIIHSYYTVVLAPAIGVLVGAGVVELWRLRARSFAAGLALALGILAAAVWSAVLLNRTPDFLPGIDVVVVMVALAAAVVIAFPEGRHFPRLSVVAASAALIALLVGPSAYALSTMNTGFAGGDPAANLSALGATQNGGYGGGQGGQAGPGRVGGGPGTDTANQELYDYLLANRGSASWLVAVQGGEQAAAIELATGQPVMAMGGFSGSDPTPTLDQLKAYVASGELRFVIVGGGGPGGGGFGGGFGGRGSTGDVASWVTANGTLVGNVGGVALYDLSSAVTAAN